MLGRRRLRPYHFVVANTPAAAAGCRYPQPPLLLLMLLRPWRDSNVFPLEQGKVAILMIDSTRHFWLLALPLLLLWRRRLLLWLRVGMGSRSRLLLLMLLHHWLDNNVVPDRQADLVVIVVGISIACLVLVMLQQLGSCG